MRIHFDWKFFLTLLVAVAGVAAPVWLWQVDLSSKEVKLTIRSVVEMRPGGLAPLEGIQVSVDGKKLFSPFVSALEISNSGSKPILATDFEGPLRIAVADPARVVKVQLGTTTPISLEPKIELTKGAVLIQPLLLNSGDIIRLTLVTANAKPEFTVRGRIAGISEISTDDAQSARSRRLYWASTITGTLLLIIYMVNMLEFAPALIRKRFIPSALATGLVSIFAAMQILQESVESPGWLLAIAALASLPLSMWRTPHFGNQDRTTNVKPTESP